MQITATMVKELRQRTGAGMMECKKYLSEANGDAEKAIDLIRKSGQVKAVKRGSKIAAEGCVRIEQNPQDAKQYIMTEVNCETDFVAKDASFQVFVQKVVDSIAQQGPADLQTLMACTLADDKSLEKKRSELVGKIGENIQVRRFQSISPQGDQLASYVHNGRIAVLVDMKGGSANLAKDIAMHIAATAPVCIDESGVPAKMLANEKSIFLAQAKESGKSDEIAEKMVLGKLRKFFEEITLIKQKFVKDPEKKIQQLLKENNAEILAFHRYELGEGIEKKQENFADEVMEQVKQSKQ